MKEFVIGVNDAGQRLDRFVQKAVPTLPPALMQKYIRLKRIKVNGKGAGTDYRLTIGDGVQMYINDEFFDIPKEENSYLSVVEPKVSILYEDDNILLADKRPGMLCHSDGSWDYNTLVAHIQAYLYKTHQWRPREENAFAPALCNRIDRNTGGIVIAAKNAVALRIMNEKIKNREIEKIYLCAVHGRPSPPSGRLESFLFKDAKKNQVFVKDSPIKGGKTAITLYRTLTSSAGLSLVECRLVTGRTHQIRAQLAHAGYPLLGDGKYGSLRQDKGFDEKGQALYSYSLKFAFQTDAGPLDYLNGATYSVQTIEFVEKYFPDYNFN